MELDKYRIKIFEYLVYSISFILFLFFFKETLNYGRTYDDFALVDRFIKSPGDAKLIASFLYAKFHFYPIYFLTHALDNFITFLFVYNGIEILNSQVAKFTNIFLHVTNSFLVYLLIKKIFIIEKNLKDNIFAYAASLIFLFHPITSQIIFNITTRNESLALFFGLLTFIYCLNNSYERKIFNFLVIALLFFFSLCSKLMTIFFAGLIPLTIFLLNFHKINIKENFKRNFDVFITLILTFFIYYYLRSIFTEKNNLYFFQNYNELIFYFFTTLKFYLIGLFFPYEHIYVYATNYDLGLSIIVFCLFLIFSIYSIYLFYKKKDPILLISVLWICASLTLPVLFGLIEYGFPLISNLAERYQYTSVVSLSIILTWILKNFFNETYKKTFVLSSYILILIFSIFVLIDRSKVYINNNIFMSQIDENSPKNIHQYAFRNEIRQSILEGNTERYNFNLYQWYQLDTSSNEAILEFLRFYIFKKNDEGIEFFENEYKKYYDKDPSKKFVLVKFYNLHEKYEKAEFLINEIFEKYDELTNEMLSKNQRVVFLDPETDDLHFELGKIFFNQKKYEKALESFKTANIINPRHATALYNAAITLKEMGLDDEAGKLYQDAIKINPFLRETVSNMIDEVEFNER